MVFGEPPWPKIGEEDLSVRVTNDLVERERKKKNLNSHSCD